VLRLMILTRILNSWPLGRKPGVPKSSAFIRVRKHTVPGVCGVRSVRAAYNVESKHRMQMIR
jgi:hypothetical protein